MPVEESDEDYAKRMLGRADQILASVDEAFIVKQRGHSARPMPTFRPEELSLGAVLGTGGFGIVNEISKFTLDDDVEAGKDGKENGTAKHTDGEANQEDDDDEEAPLMEVSVQNKGSGSKQSTTEEQAKTVKGLSDLVQSQSTDDHLARFGDGAHDDHYDIDKARRVMSARVMRQGKGRYALKRLLGDLTVLERARGMVDLAVEAKYLSIVWHPNISKKLVAEFHNEAAHCRRKSWQNTHSYAFFFCSQNERHGLWSHGR